MVHQRGAFILGHHFGQQGLDKMIEVIHLLQLAAAVLIDLAVARKDVQRLQQLD